MIKNPKTVYPKSSACSANTDTLKRQVFVNEYYNGCSDDKGWFMLKDYDASSGCTEWDVTANAPYFYYSGDSTNINWQTGKTTLLFQHF